MASTVSLHRPPFQPCSVKSGVCPPPKVRGHGHREAFRERQGSRGAWA